MSDSDKPKDPRASGAESFPPAPAEAELDIALAAAADLAAGLAKEVRESDPPIPRTSAKDERLALDQELAELERLTHKTAEDLGAETPTPPPKKKKKRSPAAVPDFMSEFTDSAPGAPPREGVGHASSGADAADTVMGELLSDPPVEEAGKKAPPIDPASLKRRGAASASAAEKEAVEVTSRKMAQPAAQAPVAGSAAVLAEADDLQAPPAAGAGRALGVVGNIENPSGKTASRRPSPQAEEVQAELPPAGGFGQKLYPAAERLVGVLEILDKPFGWVGAPVRQIIGWFALATILTSMIVLFVAMFT